MHCYCPQGLDHDDDDNDDANNHNHDNGSGCNANQPYLCLLIMPVNQENNIFFALSRWLREREIDVIFYPHSVFEKNRGYWTTMIRVIT